MGIVTAKGKTRATGKCHEQKPQKEGTVIH
jgi:hypothetical protein